LVPVRELQGLRAPHGRGDGQQGRRLRAPAPATAGMKEGVRYQAYETADGRHVLFMASEQAFWRNFCEGIGRPELFETWPGSTSADPARTTRELQAILRDVFKQRTADEWMAFGGEVDTPIAPINTPVTLADDPQFADRLGWIPHELLGADE